MAHSCSPKHPNAPGRAAVCRRMLPPDQAAPLVARTELLARALEDDELIRRVDRDARALAG